MSRGYRARFMAWIAPFLLSVPTLAVHAEPANKPGPVVASGEEAALWDRFMGTRELFRLSRLSASQALAEFEALLKQCRTTQLEAFVRLYIGTCLFRMCDYERSLAALEELKRDFPDHYVCRRLEPLDSIVDTNIDICRKQMSWIKEHPVDLTRPKPNDDVIAEVDTSEGKFVLGFFKDLAPKHVQNFLRLAEEGKFNNTYVFHVFHDFWIKFGDTQATNPADKSAWSQGGVTYNLTPEPSKLSCIRGSLVQERPFGPGTQGQPDHGSQMSICVAYPTFLDGEATVFGEVIEGMDVVEAISRVEVESSNLIPAKDVLIRSVTIKRR